VTGGELVSLDQVREAAERLKGVSIPTPTLPSAELSDLLDGEVRLKCESLQRAGAFKIRGAYNFISRLGRGALDRGVITYSSGNHAQAVALAAGIVGARSVVVMPTTAPDVKRRGAERLGAEVILEGTTSLERRARAEEIAEAEGLTIVPPFDDPRIIAGQGTVGLEIHEAWPDVQAVLVPVGGGGLLSGIAATLRRLRPEVVVLGVEPRGAASMRLALDEGGPAALDTIETIADGLAPVRAGELTFRHVRDLVDDVVTVDDDAIRDATRFLLMRQKLVVEFSGAATVAALRAGVVSAQGRKVVAVLSGGNAEPSALRELLE